MMKRTNFVFVLKKSKIEEKKKICPFKDTYLKKWVQTTPPLLSAKVRTWPTPPPPLSEKNQKPAHPPLPPFKNQILKNNFF